MVYLSTARVNGRIITIDVLVGGQPTWVNTLTYAVSPSTKRSRITTVTQFGKDAAVNAQGAVTGSNSLTLLNLTYTGWTGTNQGDFTTSTWYSQGGSDTATRWAVADLNGDGRGDLVRTEDGCGSRKVLISSNAWSTAPSCAGASSATTRTSSKRSVSTTMKGAGGEASTTTPHSASPHTAS